MCLVQYPEKMSVAKGFFGHKHMTRLMRTRMMDIQPIKNEQDYDRAIAEIERLWGAEEGTEAGDRLDILLTLVEDYETRCHPISPPTGSFVRLMRQSPHRGAGLRIGHDKKLPREQTL